MEGERLIFVGDLTPYRQSLSGGRRRQYRRLLEQADRYAAMDLPAQPPKESTTYMGIAIVNLALAYRLSGTERYLADARRFMETVLGYEAWGNAHLVNVDLSASWILFGLSLGYDWLKPFLSPEERRRVAEKLLRHARIMLRYRRETYGQGWSTNFLQNHNWINMTGLAAAGYALRDQWPEAEDFVREAREDLQRVFPLLAEDGSNYEGVTYWRYGGMWLFVYAHLLKIQEGTDYFQTSPYLRNTFYYRLYQSSGDLRCQMNYGDCHDRHSSHSACVYYKVAAEYGDGYAQRLGNLVTGEFLMEEARESKVKPGILPEAAFEFLWYDPSVEERDLAQLPLERYFPDLGLLSIRDGWGREAKALSIKCAPPGGHRQWERGWEIFRREGIRMLSLGHHHPDNLSYLFVRGGEYFTCEDGYNRNLMPDHHNVLLVDGAYTDARDVNDVYMTSVRARLEREGADFSPAAYEGHVSALELRDGLVLYRGETAGVYPAELKMREVSRLLVTDRLEFWILVDVLSGDEPHIFSTICNTDQKGRLGEDGCVYPMETGAIRCRVFSDRPFRQRQYGQEVVSVMTSQEPDKVCRTALETLRTDSAGPERTQVFFQCFTFEGAGTRLDAQGRRLRVEHGGRRICVQVGRWDDQAGRTPISVSAERGESLRFEV